MRKMFIIGIVLEAMLLAALASNFVTDLMVLKAVEDCACCQENK